MIVDKFKKTAMLSQSKLKWNLTVKKELKSGKC